MMIFGRWSLWIAIGVFGFVIAGAMAAAGNIVLAVVLVIALVAGGYHSLREGTNF